MQFDAITIGGGFAGLTAANRAAQLGAKVAVLEAREEELYLCSSRYSSGVFAVMGHTAQDRPEDIFDAFVAATDNTVKPELAHAIADNAARTLAWMREEGAMFIMAPAPTSNYVMMPRRRFEVGLNWEGLGPDNFMRRLEAGLTGRGGQVMRGTRVTSLVIEDGACVGVNAVRNGAEIRIDAKAVLVADGGFPANPDMVRRYISPRPDRILVRAGPGAKGDGIRMAEAAGAAIGGFGKFYGHVMHADAIINPRLWPYPHFDAMAEAAVLVGPDGKRFVDEGLGGICQANGVAGLEDPMSAFIIFDEAIWTGKLGTSGVLPCNPGLADAGGSISSAPDLATLSKMIGLPPAALIDTVDGHNEAVRSQRMDSLPVPRTVTARGPLPILAPPFHAAPLCAGITGTMGGIEIDARARALRPDGSALPGLYAAGTVIAHLEGGPHAGYAGGLCKAFILGLLAGEHIAGSL